MRKLETKDKIASGIIDLIGLLCKPFTYMFYRRSGRIGRKEIKSILVFEPWGIGDLVIATYFLPALRETFSESIIYLLCSPYAAELMGNCPYVDKVISYKFEWTSRKNKYSVFKYDWRAFFSLLFKIRKIGLDLAITGRPDPRYNVMLWLSGAKQRVGYGGRGGGTFLTVKLCENEKNQHHLLRWGAALSAVECGQGPIKHGFWLSRGELKEADRLIEEAVGPRDKFLVGIHCGASDPQGRWPIEKFNAVGELVSKDPRVRVLFFSVPNEINRNVTFQDKIVLPNVNLRILAALISKLDLLVCNDSGPMHLADAVTTPVVALFGRTLPNEFGPTGRNDTVIEGKVTGRPCYVDCKCSKARCWESIAVYEVVDAIEKYVRT